MIKVIKKSPQNNFLYRCSKLDTLEGIADKFNLSKEEILLNNPLFSGVYEGCMLWLSGVGKHKVIVKPLQTLQDIATEHNTTTEKLIQINNLKSSRVFVGMQLYIDKE